jgi:DNA-binding NtrC family response regulator
LQNIAKADKLFHMEYKEVYIYDPNPAILELYEEIFKDNIDAKPVFTCSVLELIERIQEKSPSLLVFDVELCRNTRAVKFDIIEKIKHIYSGPLFYTTCANLTKDEINKLNPEIFFPKPFNLDSFTNQITECLNVLDKNEA